MAHDKALLLKELPFYSVPLLEFQKDFCSSTITKTDIINHDFLNEVNKLYCNELFCNLNFDYYTPDSFNAIISKELRDIKFSLFHMNIRSLNKNNEEFSQFISTLNFDFDVLVLSEVWSCNITLYNNLFIGYDFYHDLPLSSDVGGIGM